MDASGDPLVACADTGEGISLPFVETISIADNGKGGVFGIAPRQEEAQIVCSIREDGMPFGCK